MIAKDIEKTKKISAQNISKFEAIASGHRACQGCGEILAMRQAIKALGEDIIVLSATGCMEVVTSPYPHTAWNVPWIHVAFENVAAVASGVAAARKAMARKGRLSVNKTKIIATAGDGGTYDIGLQALSGALERFHDFVYLCFDNEAYMNTGIQRSSSTPWGCWTTTSPIGGASAGKMTLKKDLLAIIAAHKIPYVATASPAYYLDLMNKVRKAADMPGPAFVHIFSPCPTGWRMPAQYSIASARLAVETNVYPLYEVVNGKYTITRKVKKQKPVKEYLKIQGTFSHLTETHIEAIQSRIDQNYAELELKVCG